ncbi:MAG: hypothetical protein EA420_16495 [Candidatus Competibacteraceae bacterium]|nr:MAG: hypothetical protein EA420_16495 [Candidatus Competibacteraceae bacterium]
MSMQNPIIPFLSPAFQAVMEIARHAGGEMTVARHQSFRFPAGTVQVWEFRPHRPLAAAARPPVTVAVLIRPRGIADWTPLTWDFDGAIQHYAALARAPNAPPVLPQPAGGGAS